MSKLFSSLKTILNEGPIGIYFMALFIPLNPRMLGIAVAIIIVEQLIRNPRVKKNHLQSQLSWKNPGVWLLAFYLMHVVGLIHTENMSFANMDLGMKATLGVFPIFFMLYKVKIKWKTFIRFFILGAFISVFWNIALSMETYLKYKNIYFISGEYLSHLMHRGYWAVYLLLAYFFLIKQMLKAPTKKLFWLNALGALFMVVFIVMSGAKVGFILLFFVTVWAILSLFKKFNNKWILPSSFAVLLSVILFIIYFVPSVSNRVSSAISFVSQPIESFDKVDVESTTARIMLWDSSLELIVENFWFGVGTGDIKDELIQRNYDKGYVGIADRKLNSHNQFFNSHIALGVFGSLFLLLSIGMNYLKRSPDEFRSWRIGIITILFVALLPESMLETQAGIIPYAFFITFLTSFQAKKLA